MIECLIRPRDILNKLPIQSYETFILGKLRDAGVPLQETATLEFLKLKSGRLLKIDRITEIQFYYLSPEEVIAEEQQ